MLLTELHGYRQYLDKTAAEIVDGLKKHGHKVANGSYAVTLIPQGKDYVYRIFTKDTGYEKFMKYLNDQTSTHYVKVHKQFKMPMPFKRPEAYGDYMNIVKLEKLEPIKNELIADTLDAIKALMDNEDKPLKVDDWLEQLSDWMGNSEDDDSNEAELEEARDFIRKNRAFFKELEKTYHEALKLGVAGDLHSNNVMMRGKEMVITDPFVSYNDSWATAADMLGGYVPPTGEKITNTRAKSEQ